MLFNAISSPEGATRIPGCDADNEQSRNARCSFRATLLLHISTVGWAGFIKPNIGDDIDADVGQTMKLFTQPKLRTLDMRQVVAESTFELFRPMNHKERKEN
jgi:hypothetical protein